MGPVGKFSDLLPAACLTVQVSALQLAGEEMHPWPGVLAKWEKFGLSIHRPTYLAYADQGKLIPGMSQEGEFSEPGVTKKNVISDTM